MVSSNPRSETERRGTARRVAAIVALVVLLTSGAALVAVELGQFGGLSASRTTTKIIVEKPATTIRTDGQQVLENGTTVPTTTKVTTPRTVEITKTANASDTSLLGIASRNPATRWILELLLAALVAFLAGAATQRILLGHYGFSIGSLTVEELPEVTEARAAAALANIDAARVAKVRTRGANARTPEWWEATEDPARPGDAIFKFQRVALEAAARDAASRRALPQLVDIVSLLELLAKQSEFPDRLAKGSMALITIGDEIFAGAAVDTDAREKLVQAHDSAIKKFGGLLPA